MLRYDDENPIHSEEIHPYNTQPHPRYAVTERAIECINIERVSSIILYTHLQQLIQLLLTQYYIRLISLDAYKSHDHIAFYTIAEPYSRVYLCSKS